jgi:hypothetical protein
VVVPHTADARPRCPPAGERRSRPTRSARPARLPARVRRNLGRATPAMPRQPCPDRRRCARPLGAPTSPPPSDHPSRRHRPPRPPGQPALLAAASAARDERSDERPRRQRCRPQGWTLQPSALKPSAARPVGAHSNGPGARSRRTASERWPDRTIDRSNGPRRPTADPTGRRTCEIAGRRCTPPPALPNRLGASAARSTALARLQAPVCRSWGTLRGRSSSASEISPPRAAPAGRQTSWASAGVGERARGVCRR